MSRVSILLAAALALSSVSAQASGYAPFPEILEGVDIENVTLERGAYPSQLRVSMVISNSNSHNIQINGVQIGGQNAEIILNGQAIDPYLSGIMVEYDEEIDFSSSHLIAVAEKPRVSGADSSHIEITISIDQKEYSLMVHNPAY